MALESGTRLGSYEIISPIGSGGMGQVYRAQDVRLDRSIAIKVLPESFARDPDRVARFEREAKALASLNHPNIAQIYDTGRGDGGAAFLAMELVPGEDLAERIRRGPVPVAEALQIARQVADALEAAHEAGIIHRDLKPANIKVRDDGTVKVLDFGLAKAAGQGTQAGAPAPTMTSPAMTEAGIILGTAAYMSPEQARGRGVDKRSDIWAFGVVLFELLTGRQLFATDTMSDTIVAVLTREVDLSQLPADVPAGVVSLIRRCLEREPRRRLRDIGDARIELEVPGASGTFTVAPSAAAAQQPQPARHRGLIVVTVVLGLALAAALVALWRATKVTAPQAASIQFDVSPPPGATLSLLSSGSIAGISEDGSLITMIAVRNGISRVYVRRRGSVEVKEVPGTEGTTDATLSPDGKWLAVWIDDALKKLSVDGAAAITLAKGRAARGVAWLDNETVVAANNVLGGLEVVPAGGGAATSLTEPDAARGERSHRWPAAVPGGKAVLFTIGTTHSPDDYNDSQIDAVVVATKVRKKVLDAASFVRCTWDGRLIYARSGVLYSIGFDPDRLQTVGVPAAVLPGVEGEVSTGAAHFAIARDGTLVYAPGPGGTNERQLVWMDRLGAVTSIDVPPGYYNDPDVSPDGRRIVVVVGASGHGDVWMYDSDRKHFGRFTFDGHAATPRWSADGRAIYYASIDPASNKTSIVRKEVDAGVAPVTVASIDSRAYIGSLAPSDAFAVVGHVPATDIDIVKMPISPAGPNVRILATKSVEMSPRLSPDGRWLAYVAASTGAPNLFVRELDGQGQWQISTAGGLDPRWSADGRELYYRNETRQMVVPIDMSSGFRPGAVRVLFEGAINWHTESGTNYGVDPKTGRFLMLRPPQHTVAPVVRVITNWLASTGGTP